MANHVSSVLLSGVTETLLLTARAKYLESTRDDALFKDTKVEEIFSRIDYDFQQNKLKKVFIGGMVARTRMYDELLLDWTRAHPQGTVVCLGAGLDTRMSRLGLTQYPWIDVDLPEVIDVRENFFERSHQHVMLANDVRDTEWFEEVPKDLPVCIIGEGLFPYLKPEENATLFQQMQEAFPGATVLLDLASPLAVKRRPYQANIKKVRANLEWGCKTGAEIDDWLRRPAFQQDYRYLLRYPERLPATFRLALKLIPPLKEMGKVVRLVL